MTVMKYFSILFFLAFQFVQAQQTVKGTFVDSIPSIRNIALYQLVKGESKYLKYTTVENNSFTFLMDELAPGYYRVLYKNINTGYVDFIYNKENIVFKLNSTIGQNSAEYSVSRENQLLQAYNYNIANLQHKLDSVQMGFFNKPKPKKKIYKKIKNKIDGAQTYYENLAKKDFCLSMIKASKRYNAPLPFTLPSNYISSIKTHFFDYINFDDKELINSTFVKSRISDYVFYLNQSDNINIQNEQYISSIHKVLSYINDEALKENILAFLIKKIIKKENPVVLSEIVNIYKLLPKEFQKKTLLTETTKLSRTLIGVIPPDIKLSKKESLYNLNTSEKYLIIFWSSTCSHCSKELPKVKTFLKEHKEVTVVSIGIENDEDKNSWTNEIRNYSDWKNIISLGKWESKEALNYNINATPSFFLLDRNKHIIAKPNNLEELKKAVDELLVK